MTTRWPALFIRSEKSPLRLPSVGTVERIGSLTSCRVRSHVVKKNVFPCVIGPPKVPPNWFQRTSGFEAAKKFFASSASCRNDSNALPLKLLVPERLDIAMMPQLESPCSAEYV